MNLKRINKVLEKLENPKYPLLGPNIKALFMVGMWKSKHILGVILSYSLLVLGCSYNLLSQIQIFILMKDDILTGLVEVSFMILGAVAEMKFLCFIIWQREWKQLFKNLSMQEKNQVKQNDDVTINIINKYRKYARSITYGYWSLVAATLLIVIATPFLKYLTSNDIHVNNKDNFLIMKIWSPFHINSTFRYLITMSIQVIVVTQGAGTVAAFDTSAISIMTFFSGQMKILRNQCSRIFDGDEHVSRNVVLDRIKKCHEHHNTLIENFALLNFLLSPIMFVYILNSAICICCSVVQLTMIELSISQKIFVVEYTVAISAQLFIYCWHGNEVVYTALKTKTGVYKSKYWKGDAYLHKHLVLLAGKLSQDCVLKAGPFHTVRISTFIDILKASYSFYTLLDHIQE